jgi:hypothetical protein
MLLAQGASHGPQSLEPLLVVLAILAVLFWRIALRILTVVIAVLLLTGTLALLHHLQHLR